MTGASRARRRALSALGVLLAALTAAAAEWLVLVHTLVGTCGVSDTAQRFPADASPQGRVCGAGELGWEALVAASSFVLAVVVAVGAVVVLWRRTRGAGRLLAVLPIVLVPLLHAVVLGLPPDSCSPEDRRALPEHSCRTSGEG